MKNEEMDNLFRNEIDGLEGLPEGVSWSKEDGWEKLNSRLQQSPVKRGGGGIALWTIGGLKGASQWLYASAAAVTMLLCVNFIYQHHNEVAISEVIISEEVVDKFQEQKNESLNKIFSGIEKPIQFDQISKFLSKPENENPPTDLDNKSVIQYLYGSKESGLALTNDGDQDLGVDYFRSRKSAFANLVETELNDGTTHPLIKIFNENKSSGQSKLILQANTNMGMMGSNVSPGLELDLTMLTRNKGGQLKNQFSVGLAAKYQLFDLKSSSAIENQIASNAGERQNGLNTFITAGYRHNFSKDEDKPFWLGVKAGYMVQNNTTNLEGETMMVELNIGNPAGGKISIAPQIYLTDDFKKVIPGIKLGVNINAYEKDIAI